MQNKYIKSIISIILVCSILFSFSSVFSVSAESKTGYITHDSVRVRTSPTSVSTNNILKHNGNTINLNTGDIVTILDTVDSDGDDNHPKWCYIKFKYNGVEYEGFISAKFVREKTQDSPGGIMPDGVPELYKSYIKDLINEHPNWKFVFYDTGIEWSSLFEEDAQGFLSRSLVNYVYPISYRSTQSGAYNWRTDKWISQDSGGWYQANKQTIAHYMDPRNFFNEKDVFMFESLKYNSTSHTINGVNAIIDGSFMDGKTTKNTSGQAVSYAQAYIDAGFQSKVSPYHLASRTIQEVGKNGSDSTSGTYGSYAGYYNFYNIHAFAGSDPVGNALKYARGDTASESDKKNYDIPWNTPYKAIVGGAKWIGAGYINRNQDTLYYQKFNVVNKVWTHQYMSNIIAPYKEAETVYKSYSKLGILNENFTFIIPYFKNMPEKACPLPKNSNASPNNWLSSLTIEGLTFNFDGGKTSGYTLTVAESVSSVNITAKTVNSKATVSGIGKVQLSGGTNNIKVVVKAENGDSRTYYIDIVRSTENEIPLKGISLDKTELSMFNGESKTLTVKYNPSNTTDSKAIIWTSSDKSVATVEDGKVIAIGKGTATITAKVGAHTSICKVTVSNDVIIGDIDADGYVTISDALLIFKYKTNEITLSSTALKAADTDKNGKVELADALKIFKYKSGEIESL